MFFPEGAVRVHVYGRPVTAYSQIGFLSTASLMGAFFALSNRCDIFVSFGVLRLRPS